MEKHVPVLLDGVMQEFESLSSRTVVVLDCTLGQAGHSVEIFKKITKGLLISVDLSLESIEWVASNYDFEVDDAGYLVKDEGEKKWVILQSDFADIDNLLEEFNVSGFDYILADLGFSNFQLTLNLGISYSHLRQRLDMRYLIEEGVSAAEVLNTFDAPEIEKILFELGQIDNPKVIVHEIINKRKSYKFERVEDVLKILNKSKFPQNYKTKFFQALRSFVNSENARLESLLEKMPELLTEQGKCAIITFNSVEENLIRKHLTDVEVKEPNITEIIKNPQSRSAKLYIYKKKRITS
jgi:16S rRNA (cytosine1402-N4)-methyltransferase